MKKWIKRIVLSILFLFGITMLTGFVYEQISRHEQNKGISDANGQYVDVGGHKLYCEIKGKGGPTVVFESGLMSNHTAFAKIQEDISKHTTTVIYDRAGISLSERGSNSKNSNTISDELYQLLQETKLPKPYIMVGHSFGGIALRPFIKKYSNEIKGVVFVDVSHPDQVLKAPKHLQQSMKIELPPKWILKLANEIGAIRYFTGMGYLYRDIQKEGVLDEIDYLNEENAKISEVNSFGDMPLVVISAASKDNFNNGSDQDQQLMIAHWDKLQEEIKNLSTNSKRILAKKSKHQIMDTEPEIITNEILKMLHPIDSLKN